MLAEQSESLSRLEDLIHRYIDLSKKTIPSLDNKSEFKIK